MMYLVTGAAGLLGSNLVQLLLEEHATVRAFVRSHDHARALAAAGVECMVGDVRDREAVDAAVRGCAGVFHCAAEVSPSPRDPDLFHGANVVGTANVARAVLQAHLPRLVYVSTADTVGRRSDGRPADERVEYMPRPDEVPYVASKWKAERYVLSSVEGDGLPAVVANPTVMLGYGGHRLSSREYVRAVARGLVVLAPAGGSNFVDVRDVAVGLLRAMRMGAIGQRYILGGTNMSYREFFTLVARLLGVRPPMGVVPPGLAALAGGAGDLLRRTVWPGLSLSRAGALYVSTTHYVDTQLAVEQLGLPQSPLISAVERAIAWLRERGLA